MTIKDSGKREEFTTGSRRDTREGKGRYDLLSPISLKRLAVHMENGIKKYGERNWEKGQPLMRYLDSALRHIQVYIEGNREEDHMAAAMWNIHGFIHTQTMIERGELPKELDDVPSGFLSCPTFPKATAGTTTDLPYGCIVWEGTDGAWLVTDASRSWWWCGCAWVALADHTGCYQTKEQALLGFHVKSLVPPPNWVEPKP